MGLCQDGLLNRNIPLTDGDHASGHGQHGQSGKHCDRAARQSHRAPVLPKVLSDERVLRNAADRGRKVGYPVRREL